MEGKTGDLEGLAATTTKALKREEAPETSSKDTEMSAPSAETATEEFPDPEEDDLDDLDGSCASPLIRTLLTDLRYA